MDVFKNNKSLSSITSPEDVASANNSFIVDVPEEFRSSDDPRYVIVMPSTFKNLKTTISIRDFLEQIKSDCGENTEDCELCHGSPKAPSSPVSNKKDDSYSHYKESGTSKNGNFNQKHYEPRPPLRRKRYQSDRREGSFRRQADNRSDRPDRPINPDPWIFNSRTMNYNVIGHNPPFGQNFHTPLLPLPQSNFSPQDTQQYHNMHRNFPYPPRPLPQVYNEDVRYAQGINNAPSLQQEQNNHMQYNMNYRNENRRRFNGKKNGKYRR